MNLDSAFEFFNFVICGWLFPVFLIGVGVFLSVRLAFLQVRKIGSVFRSTIFNRSAKSDKTPRGSLSTRESISTALASTIGTGSIVGVSIAIYKGGPGAVFWMWIGAFLGMAIKYSEIVLAILYRSKNHCEFSVGGPMYYLRDGLGLKTLAVFFSVFCILACFGMGNTVQANAITSSLENHFQWNRQVIATVLSIIVGVVVLGGVRRIASFNAKLVPIMSFLYVFCCLLVIGRNFTHLPAVFHQIFKEAFRAPSVAGGVSSFGIFVSMQNGFSKAMFSNEAGLGSAPIAHGSGGNKNPIVEGFWGIFEMFFTTVVICTLTALSILCTSVVGSAGGAERLTYDAFNSVFPQFGGALVSVSTVLFALSTILGWGFYGESCLSFLLKKDRMMIRIFRVLFVIAVYFGSVGSISLIWNLSEVVNVCMAIPNLIGILFLSGQVAEVTKKYFNEKCLSKK